MAKYQYMLFSFFSSILIVSLGPLCSAADEDRKVYIVYMGSLPSESKYSPSDHHFSLLQEVVDASSLHNSLIRSYTRSFNGFAAKLTNHEKEKLERMDGVVSVFPSRKLQLQTTRSWEFMGFHENTERTTTTESDIIIGVIDSGIWPESESFSDDGFSPAPKKWKGVCNGGDNFTCNNKIIGAKSYSVFGLPDSPRDDVGHGSHTASTAAGNKVKDVSFYGLAKGTARGGVPSARIAVYRVCRADEGCFGVDALAAFDDAIADGVDIITISIGGDSSSDFAADEISIGSFHAMQKGILTANSAGNSGPTPGTVVAVAPWLLSVAASTIDRRIVDKVVLGNGKTLLGRSINIFTQNGTKFPLVYGSNISRLCSIVGARMCSAECLDESLVKGKIVLCDQSGGIPEAQRAGAVGSIVQTNRYDNNPSSVVSFPASTLSVDDYNLVKSYLNSTNSPEAGILKSESIQDSSAPVVASFSARGPNIIAPDILKPDITAPGIDILAAYIPINSPNGDDKRQIRYNIVSGTSMSCPHVAGVAAYVKAFHPDWSPSAIQSAIMTTAFPMNAVKNSDAEFAYGSGHINPVKAISPGLVYEASKHDYINFLCSIGYTTDRIRSLSGDNSSCPDGSEKASTKDLNYPSMTAKVFPKTSFNFGFHRTVTNVGFSNSTYKAKVFSDSKVHIKIVPQILSFKSLHEKKSFHVTVAGRGLPRTKTIVSSSLVWSDGIHSVRSPIVVYTN